MQATVYRDDFQSLITALTNNGYIITNIETLPPDKHNMFTYSITYEKPTKKGESK